MTRWYLPVAALGICAAGLAMGCAGAGDAETGAAELRSVAFDLALSGDAAETSSRGWNYQYARKVSAGEVYSPQDDPDHTWANVRDYIAQTIQVDIDGDGEADDGAIVLGNDHFARHKQSVAEAPDNYYVYYHVFLRNELSNASMYLPAVSVTSVSAGWQILDSTKTVYYYDYDGAVAASPDYDRFVPPNTTLHGSQWGAGNSSGYQGVKGLDFLSGPWSDGEPSATEDYVPLERKWEFQYDSSLLTGTDSQNDETVRKAWEGGFSCKVVLSWYTSDPGTP